MITSFCLNEKSRCDNVLMCGVENHSRPEHIQICMLPDDLIPDQFSRRCRWPRCFYVTLKTSTRPVRKCKLAERNV